MKNVRSNSECSYQKSFSTDPSEQNKNKSDRAKYSTNENRRNCMAEETLFDFWPKTKHVAKCFFCQSFALNAQILRFRPANVFNNQTNVATNDKLMLPKNIYLLVDK